MRGPFRPKRCGRPRGEHGPPSDASNGLARVCMLFPGFSPSFRDVVDDLADATAARTERLAHSVAESPSNGLANKVAGGAEPPHGASASCGVYCCAIRTDTARVSSAFERLAHEMGSRSPAVANVLVKSTRLFPIDASVQDYAGQSISSCPCLGSDHQLSSGSCLSCTAVNNKRLHHRLARLLKSWPFVGMHESADPAFVLSNSSVVRLTRQHATNPSAHLVG